jgi:hypothetical protein
VTPPPLTKRSGQTIIPFLIRTSSPAKVDGPLAPSKTTLHYNLSALFLLIDFSTAAGTRISHGFVMNSKGLEVVESSAPGKPYKVPFSEKYFLTSSTLKPFEL